MDNALCWILLANELAILAASPLNDKTGKLIKNTDKNTS